MPENAAHAHQKPFIRKQTMKEKIKTKGVNYLNDIIKELAVKVMQLKD
jgi:hypothetical protein